MNSRGEHKKKKIRKQGKGSLTYKTKMDLPIELRQDLPIELRQDLQLVEDYSSPKAIWHVNKIIINITALSNK